MNQLSGMATFPVKLARKLFLKYHSKYRTWYVCDRHHITPIDPLELIWINPNEIIYVPSNKDFYFEAEHVSEVVSGDWDQDTYYYNNSNIFRGFYNRFIKGCEWEETDFYQRVINTINSGTPKWGCHSEEEFQRRCDRLDMVFEEIQTNGYKSQKEIIKEKYDDPLYERMRSMPPEFYEIRVHIGRNGDFLFHEGSNRLCIAKLAGVDRVPVRVKVRHFEWQKYRDDVARGRVLTKRDHPDLTNSTSEV